MRKTLLGFALASLVTAVSSGDRVGTADDAAPPRGAVRIRLNLPRGQSFYQRSVIRQRVVLRQEGNERTTDNVFGTGLRYDVLDRDETGAHTLRVTYDWVRVRTTLGQDRLDYDSSESIDPATPHEVQYAAQVGQAFVVRMDEHGGILAFEDLPALHERMARRITELGGRGRAHLPAIRRQFGEQSLRDGLGVIAAVLPDTDVEIGGTWKETSSNAAGLPREIDATYRLVKVENGMAMIAADIGIRSPAPPGEETKATNQPLQWHELSGSDTGTYRVDLATGWILDAETRQSLEGTTHSRRGENEVVADIVISSTTRLTSSSEPLPDT